MYVSFSHKMHRKKRIEENANVGLFETDNQACTGRSAITATAELVVRHLSK